MRLPGNNQNLEGGGKCGEAGSGSCLFLPRIIGAEFPQRAGRPRPYNFKTSLKKPDGAYQGLIDFPFPLKILHSSMLARHHKMLTLLL
jgi:hypothetical protein